MQCGYRAVRRSKSQQHFYLLECKSKFSASTIPAQASCSRPHDREVSHRASRQLVSASNTLPTPRPPPLRSFLRCFNFLRRVSLLFWVFERQLTDGIRERQADRPRGFACGSCTRADPSSLHRVIQDTEQFKLDAVAMLLDGHAASEIARRLGIPNTNVLYKWRDKFLVLECPEEDSSTPPVPGRHTPHVREMAARLSRLEAELKKTQQERDILKKALIVFGQNE